MNVLIVIKITTRITTAPCYVDTRGTALDANATIIVATPDDDATATAFCVHEAIPPEDHAKNR